MDRIILHCDCNCFYASCELLSHPDLRQLPVAVCGDPTERHGIILAKNEPAKRCGVKTAETIWKAKQKCPGLILLPPHHRLYAEYSKKINAVYGEYTDLVEPFGIDESWLDVTNSLHLFGGDAKALADTLRERIKREFGLTISVGVSFNKVFAKLGSDYKKPDATTVIARDNWRDIVFPLPVGDLLFVGRSAQELLGRYGVRTIGELSKCSEEMLETLMGKMGSQLYRYANGLDDSPVRGAADRGPIKSVGNSTTFRRDLTRWDEVQSGISLLSDSVAMRLRRYGLYCGGVQVGIKNSRFQVFSRQTTLDHSTHLMREINDTALRLAKDLWKAPDPIRLLSVTALHLTEEAQSYRQLDLLGTDDTQQEKQEAVESAMDALRKKFGRGVISYGTAEDTISGEKIEREEACRLLRLDPGLRYTMFFGFIRDYKGLDLLLDAWALLSEQGKTAGHRLIIAGEYYSGKETYMNQIERLGIGDEMILFDYFVADEEVARFFSVSDLVVQPYRSATQSGVTQVAYFFDVPMVVTGVGGLREIVPDGEVGFVVDPKPQAIARAIDRYYSENLSEKFRENIRNYKVRFTWERMAENFQKLYRTICENAKKTEKAG